MCSGKAVPIWISVRRFAALLTSSPPNLYRAMLWEVASVPHCPSNLWAWISAVEIGWVACELRGRMVSAAHKGEGFSVVPDLTHGL